MNVIQKNISTSDNIKINVICFPHEPENTTSYIGSDNLYKWYDFSSGNMFKVIIDRIDIKQIAQSNFKYVDSKTIKNIFKNMTSLKTLLRTLLYTTIEGYYSKKICGKSKRT